MQAGAGGAGGYSAFDTQFPFPPFSLAGSPQSQTRFLLPEGLWATPSDLTRPTREMVPSLGVSTWLCSFFEGPWATPSE